MGLKKARKMKWISVKDRLPTFDGDVLCFSGGGRASVKLYQTHNGGFFFGNYSVNITHWMELPIAPSSKDSDNIKKSLPSSIRGSTHYDLTFCVHLKVIDGELCQLTRNGAWITSDHKHGVKALDLESDIIELRNRYV